MVHFVIFALSIKKRVTLGEITLLISQNDWAAEAGSEPSAHFPRAEPFLSTGLCWSDIPLANISAQISTTLEVIPGAATGAMKFMSFQGL